MQALVQKRAVQARPVVARRPSRATTVAPRAALPPQLVISGATATMLFLGRYVFLPIQRKTNADAERISGPKTTGNTWSDSYQKTASFVGPNGDPEGFGLIDVAGWGALGHALGYLVLAINSAEGIGAPHF